MKANPISPAFLAALLIAGAGGARADDSPLRQITVDATVMVGTLRPLSGIQAAAGTLDVTGFYKAAHIDLVRIADVPGTGTDAIFPEMGADTEDPKSYHFAAADRLIASIKSAGAEPLFRIGRGPGEGADSSAAAAPPMDPDKLAQIARHIVLHYNQRWNKGFRYAIRYWEIGGEPDDTASWSGSPEAYYSLYAKTARAIESADASALVGGPALAKPLIAGASRENFLNFVRSNRVSLDFFSWHFFAVDSNDPFTFVTVARELRRILDARGFGSTKNILDEWNADPAEPAMSKAARASFAASALIYMLGGPIDAQTFSRADADLAGAKGVPDEVGHALSAFGSLKNTPLLIRTTGGDEAGLAVAAGRSRDGRLVQILVSNYEVPAKYLKPRDNWDTSLPERRVLQYGNNGGYDAAINLAEPGKYQVKRYRINESSNFLLVDQSTQAGPTIHLQAALPPPGIELIVISAN
jgi:xylan 1,4-beta-xylosidase